MGIFSLGLRGNSDLPNINTKIIIANDIKKEEFCDVWFSSLYDRILWRLFRKTIFENKFDTSIFYNSANNEVQQFGFIELLKRHILDNSQVILQYDPTAKTITPTNEKKNKYCVSLNFEYLRKLHILLLYYATQLYQLSQGFSVSVAQAKSLVVYVDKLQENMAFNEKDSVERQVKSIIDGINTGTGAYTSSGSRIEVGLRDVSNQEKGNNYVYSQVSSLLQLSANFLMGTNTGGTLNNGNEVEALKDDETFECLWYEYFKNTIEKLFNTEITFKINKFRLSNEHRTYLDWVETNNLIPQNIKQSITADILESDGLINSKQAKEIRENNKDNNTTNIYDS
jgi:hypothetical protein